MTDPTLRDRAIEALQTIYDPEIPVNIYELGLIYEVRTLENNNIEVVMTLTTPNCPSAQSLPAEVEQTLRALPNAGDVRVTITFEPAWDKTMMSEAALFQIGLF